ncbi:MAG: hypothetical protein MK066_14555, partial [Crocinitomicaceae bacterium]|nr:hypothetical protein [Crocinitomicaceae bacterium]
MSQTPLSTEQIVRNHITTNGLTGVVSDVNNLINGTSLTQLEQKLLSNPILYAECLHYAFFTENVNESDSNGIFQACLRHLKTLVSKFYEELIQEVLDSKGIVLPVAEAEQMMKLILSFVIKASVPITVGDASDPIIEIYERVKVEGPLSHFIKLYLEKGEVNVSQLSDQGKSAMVDYLKSLNLNLPQDMPGAIASGSYDEYFALALDYALKVESGGIDPIDWYRVNGKNTWDFGVDLFDNTAKQGIISKNILGAGAVNYIFILGEQLGVFNLAEGLILEWARGAVYITDPEAEGKLYRYYKLLEERASADERGMLYKRILNVGDA